MEARSPLEAALWYARHGWSVVPLHRAADGACSCRRPDCPAIGKHPRIAWQGRTTTPAHETEVRAWWERWPRANVGVVTGLVSGIVVLDVDPRNGGDETLARFVARRFGPLPETVESATGGGGRHYWFDPTGRRLPTGRLAAGLDLKAEGGLVVAPPSVHASGAAYAWVAGRSPAERKPAPLPRWIAALSCGDVDAERRSPLAETVARTDLERAEFAQAWARAGVRLRPGDHTYLCPFHDDHHPSLHIDADGCRWFCFGCRRGGGIGRLRRLLGEEAPARPRARLRGQVGGDHPITIPGREPVDVVGESFHQDALLSLAGGRRSYGGVELDAVAELVPDADPETPGSVSVLIGGLCVGRLSREDADRYRPAIAEARVVHGLATCRAVIRGGWDRGGDDVGLFGVRLFLPSS